MLRQPNGRTTVVGAAADGAAVAGNPVLVAGQDGTNAQSLLVDSSGRQIVVGAAAHDDIVAGSPALVGGRANQTAPTEVGNGDASHLWVTRRGAAVVRIGVQHSGSDGRPNTDLILTKAADDETGGLLVSSQYTFNGSTWDRPRGNTNLTILTSAARTATVQSSDQTNYSGRGLHLVVDVTSITSTPSVVFTIQGRDALSGKYYTMLASAAITATGTTVLKVYPGIAASANVSASDILPRTWRVDATHANTDSITYSVGASVIL